ncbi:cytochrome C [Geobacter grbiciae]|uniref:cytochrome C n=1 Tax=Geobacter grbiciae TaxID=155042 RepID=UPI001C028B01|nr:cytochrome C [Geobacter grbiciae]MBT1074512.1 cytochrome C [Geobacter grbiciae]
MSFVKQGIGACVAVLVFSGTGIAAPEVPDGAVNPHASPESCGVCHVLPKEKLGSFFVANATKRQLLTNPVALCRQCHGMEFGHGIGMKPEMNRESLPLAEDRTITCAITCHAMHVKNPDHQEQERYHLRLPLSKICLSCHEK